MKNRIANVHNRYQNTKKHKRVLCVCSAGLLRSPTMAYVLSQEPFNFNTRPAGANPEYALIPVDEALIEWADEIVCAESSHADMLINNLNVSHESIKILNIPDRFDFRDPELIELIRESYQ